MFKSEKSFQFRNGVYTHKKKKPARQHERRKTSFDLKSERVLMEKSEFGFYNMDFSRLWPKAQSILL